MDGDEGQQVGLGAGRVRRIRGGGRSGGGCRNGLGPHEALKGIGGKGMVDNAGSMDLVVGGGGIAAGSLEDDCNERDISR